MSWNVLSDKMRKPSTETRIAVEGRTISFKPSREALEKLGWDKDTRVDVAIGAGEHLGLVRFFAGTNGWRLKPCRAGSSLAMRFSKSRRGVPLLPRMPERMPHRAVSARYISIANVLAVEFQLPWFEQESGLPTPSAQSEPIEDDDDLTPGDPAEKEIGAQPFDDCQGEMPPPSSTAVTEPEPVATTTIIPTTTPEPATERKTMDPSTWDAETRERYIERAAQGAPTRELSDISGFSQGSQYHIRTFYLKTAIDKRRRKIEREGEAEKRRRDAAENVPEHVLTYLRKHAVPYFKAAKMVLTKARDGKALELDGRRMPPEEVVAKANEMFELDGTEDELRLEDARGSPLTDCSA